MRFSNPTSSKAFSAAACCPSAAAVLALILALLGSPAFADSFTIDSTQSEATFSGSVSLPLASVPLAVPGVAQGTTGATLPSGLVSDGLTTFIQGSIEAELTPTTIRFRSGASSLSLGDSGDWLPGEPATPGVAAAANVAASFSDATFLTSGNFALRELEFSLTSLELPLTETGVGTNIFEFDAGSVLLRLAGGAQDLETNVVAPTPRVVLPAALSPSVGTGTLELLPGMAPKLTLPLSATNVALPGQALDATLTVSLAGQVVAVPEPNSLASGLIALGAIAALRRWRFEA